MSKITPETHEQAMACLSCGLAGLCPPDSLPQADGLWDRSCPQCGEYSVWITEPMEIGGLLAAKGKVTG